MPLSNGLSEISPDGHTVLCIQDNLARITLIEEILGHDIECQGAPLRSALVNILQSNLDNRICCRKKSVCSFTPNIDIDRRDSTCAEIES